MPRLIRSSRVAFLAVLVSSSYSPMTAQTKPTTPAPGGACLATKEEVAAALGVAVTGPTEKNIPGGMGPGSTVSSCGYEGSGLQSFMLTVNRLPPASASMYRTIICGKKKNDGLEGLGDLACWYDDKHQELHAFKGTTFILLQLKRSGDTTEAIKGVMKKALERLK